MNFFEELYYKIFGRASNFSLEHRIFVFTAFFGIIFSIFGSVINYIIQLGPIISATPLLSGIFFLYFYIQSRFNNRYSQYIFPFIILCNFSIAFSWFFNGGWDGPSGLLFYDALMISLIITHKKGKLLVLLIFMITMLTLTFIHQFYPGAVQPYVSSEARFTDIFLSIIYTLIVLYNLLNYVLKNYHIEKIRVEDEKQRTEEVNIELVSKNKLISEQIIELDDLNRQLSEVNYQISRQNSELETLNSQLSEANYQITNQNIELEELNKQETELNQKIIKQNSQLESLNESLEASNSAKDKFFSIISHDLKNPLGALRNYIELLEFYDKMDETKRAEIAKALNKSVNFVIELLENLLNWARSQSGRIEFNPEGLYIHEMIKKQAHSFEEILKKKDINLEFSNDFYHLIYADTNMLNTVLRNLISNAIKFTPENGRIVIKSVKEDSENLRISIKDNGLGISKEDIEKLFRIDIHHSTIGTAKEKGTGLGLILCKEFIEKHGGKIWVESKINEGAEFIFTLPINLNNIKI
jgi:signal transduction histidine kinase